MQEQGVQFFCRLISDAGVCNCQRRHLRPKLWVSIWFSSSDDCQGWFAVQTKVPELNLNASSERTGLLLLSREAGAPCMNLKRSMFPTNGTCLRTCWLPRHRFPYTSLQSTLLKDSW